MKDNILAVYDDDTNLKLASLIKLNSKIVVTDTEIAEHLNTSKQNLSNYRRDNRIPYSMLCELCLSKNININWLLDRKKIYSHDDFKKQIATTENAQDIYLERENKGFHKYKNLSKRTGGMSIISAAIVILFILILLLGVAYFKIEKLTNENKELKQTIELMKTK